MQGMERTVLFGLHFLHVSSCFCLMGARVWRTHPTQGNSRMGSEQALPAPPIHPQLWENLGVEDLRQKDPQR